MKLLIPCTKCSQELGWAAGPISRVEFRDDGRYEITCEHGHKTITVLQQHKFEILFDIGAYAILDGYYREAVSSFASSLERFYEFSIQVLLEKSIVPEDVYRRCWKEVSKHSERQLGAFIFLWASFFREPPELLPNPEVKFRNGVVHKGTIPTRDKAVEFGNAVLNVLRPKIAMLQEKLPGEVQKAVFYHLRRSQSEGDEGKNISAMSTRTIISLSYGKAERNRKTLEESLVELSRWREITSTG